MYDDDADRELLARCVAGDRRAWNGFVERFTRYVYYLVQLTARRYDAALAEDEVADLHNDLFVALLEDDRRRLRAYEGKNGCTVRSWVRLLTVRRTVDALRRRRPHLSLDQSVEDGEAPVHRLRDEGPDALQAMLDRAAEARVGRFHDLVARLGPPDRLLLELLYARKLDVEAAAATLGITRGALYTRKTRLLDKLRALAAEEAGDGASG